MSGILLGLGQLAQPTALLALLGGVVIGLIVGSLPGLNDSITMAVLIPITFGMEPQVAICLLVGIYCASACGGSVPSILLKIPGTASATVTAYDGYPMSQQGKSGQALGLAISSSTFGGLTSAIVLLFLSPFLAKQALKFGPPEYFMLAVLGIRHGRQQHCKEHSCHGCRPDLQLYRHEPADRSCKIYLRPGQSDGWYFSDPDVNRPVRYYFNS